jgi:hypothetical protein
MDSEEVAKAYIKRVSLALTHCCNSIYDCEAFLKTIIRPKYYTLRSPLFEPLLDPIV